MSKKLKKTKKATVPSTVIDEMKAGGADFTAAQFMGRDIIKCNSGDDAAKVYLSWMDGITDDPDVQAIWAPTGGVIPPAAHGVGLLTEANWMIHHCSTLRMNDFAGGAVPVIGGPGIGFLPLPIAVHHASVAGNYLIDLLQNPPPAYPNINLLGIGTYICTVQYVWSGVVVIIQVTKA
mmetsp:Transcript_7602/g.21126  ORF Transcript_7602/g.21126 Transcript_7602/m.21126 type:complete len:178 (-) Transcript_7602:206-739(-)|eukprot:CAMPEP_0168740912 /NCGR_PEP_ID=MMETSP0724-20121128/12232_1 /TAXON_ID=265536 /ORGANISM="Amphiprora sp., Strain CCMP467" /LENGTH=177 /DNA_ID=CAMNT_0008788379 /DNA_START=63 /DNA_END=596 /DNA_ORIENTATION=+